MRDKRVKVGEIELQIQDTEQAREAIIFLHFSGANLIMWQRVIHCFQDQYRLILVDLRGHGKSDKPASGYHMDDMARDIAGLMQQLKLERAHIVGSSLGAEVGLSLAANYPELVSSFVCDGAFPSEFGTYSTWEGTQAEYEQHVAGELEKMRARPEKVYPSLEALLEAKRVILEKYGCWNEYVETMERYSATQMEDEQFTSAFRKYANLEYMAHYFHYRLEDYYARVQCPLLMVTGAIDDEREMVAIQGLSALARQAQIVEVKGWDHPYGWLVDTEAMCQTVLKFLKGMNSKI